MRSNTRLLWITIVTGAAAVVAVEAAKAQTESVAADVLTLGLAQNLEHDERRHYVGLRASYNVADENNLVFENGFGQTAFAGRKVGDHFRVELEIARRKTDISFITFTPVDGEVRTITAMGNILYDFGPHNARLRPYVGGGVGASQMHSFAEGINNGRVIFLDNSEVTPSYQGAAGVSWRASHRITLEGGFNYFATLAKDNEGDFLNNTVFKGQYRTYGGFFSVRRSF